MARLQLKLGSGMLDQKDIADALLKRARPRLDTLHVTEAKVVVGTGTLTISGQTIEKFYVLEFEAPENCPVRDYVAYRQADGIHTAARTKPGVTIEDIEIADYVKAA